MRDPGNEVGVSPRFFEGRGAQAQLVVHCHEILQIIFTGLLLVPAFMLNEPPCRDKHLLLLSIAQNASPHTLHVINRIIFSYIRVISLCCFLCLFFCGP